MGTRSIRLLVLSIVLALMLICPGTSSAGEYEISACTESVGYIDNSWHPFDNNSHYLEVHSACKEVPTHELSAGLSNLAVGDVMGAGDSPVGVEAGWQLTAPAGTAISEVKGVDDLFKDTSNDWQVYLKNASGEILGGQTCIVEPASSFYCEVAGRFQATGLDTPSVAIGVLCTENSSHNCPGGATIHEVRAELDSATATIKDELAPTGVIGSQIPSGPQHGTVLIFGSAVDTTAGLLSLSVVNGVNEVVGGPVTPVPCDYSFTTPCPTKVENLTIPVDTTKLPNGQDQIRVVAINAAHDEAFSVPYTIDVENSNPVKEGGGGGGGGGTGGGAKPGGGGSGTTSSGGSGSSSTKTGSGSSTTQSVKDSSPAPVAIDVKGKRSRGDLVLSGDVSSGATGVITLTLEAPPHKTAHSWIRRLKAFIHRWHFRARVRLPRSLRKRALVVHVVYPGNGLYQRTTRILSINGR